MAALDRAGDWVLGGRIRAFGLPRHESFADHRRTPAETRIDRWLCAVRLVKTRPLATRLCEGGHVRVNGAPAKPSTKVRVGDVVHALKDTCSHAGGPLSQGKLEGDTIQCPWHYSVFRLSDGSVVHGPAGSRQPSYEARINGDQIEIQGPHQ